jgi:translation elongation factor EF-Tu-like GTPase
MEPSLVAKVRFDLLPGEVSGKTQGYRSNIRPNHYIAELGYTVIGNVVFDGGRIELGETAGATITYVYHEPLARILVPGLRYEVREGSRVVGFVQIESVCHGSEA